MGCDVHMYAEKRNTDTNKWEKVGEVFLDDFIISYIKKNLIEIFNLTEKDATDITFRYYDKMEPTSKFEEKLFKFISENTSIDSNNYAFETLSFLSPYIDSPYLGRNYTLFGILAGVRDRSVTPIASIDRGLPIDVSEEVSKLSSEMIVDCHSHNYLYLYEILNSEYYKMTDLELDDWGIGTCFFRKTVNSLLKIGEPKDVRIVFWFDN
jgi:hypothetical protein